MRPVRFGLVAVLAYGTVVHVVQLFSWPPYPWAPGWLAAYFVSLTVFDPLAAGLLLARRAAGLYLAIAVLASDALANGYAVYGPAGADTGTAARVGQAVISLLAVATVICAPWLRRGLR